MTGIDSIFWPVKNQQLYLFYQLFSETRKVSKLFQLFVYQIDCFLVKYPGFSQVYKISGYFPIRFIFFSDFYGKKKVLNSYTKYINISTS